MDSSIIEEFKTSGQARGFFALPDGLVGVLVRAGTNVLVTVKKNPSTILVGKARDRVEPVTPP